MLSVMTSLKTAKILIDFTMDIIDNSDIEYIDDK